MSISLRTLCIALSISVLAACTSAKNPDPDHTHADFAIFVEGKKIDLSATKYMSGSSKEKTHSGALHPDLHLHDGNGSVIHRHHDGLSVGTFFRSIGIIMAKGENCVKIEKKEYCSIGPKRWKMFVNGKQIPFDPNYVFRDLDKILFSYGETSEEVLKQQIQSVSDDACLYSQTCPERGTPPPENCVSDPEVPCSE